MIEARRLSRRFGGREAVRDVSMTVAAGEVVGFLGPNGAGKTTTMRMLVGVLRPTSGSSSVTRGLGYLPEQFTAYEALAVASNLRYLARVKGAPLDDVEPAMTDAGVADLASRPFGRLSQGQRQRVGMAQMLLGSPATCVLDEPTQGLDPRQVIEARALIRAVAHERGAAVLLSTHILAEAAAVCDRVIVIARGCVLAEERPGDAAGLEARFLRLVGETELQ